MKAANSFKRYLSMIRPFDVIIVGLLVVASFIPLLIFTNNQRQAADTRQKAKATEIYTAVISHDGHVVKRINLSDHHGITRFHYVDHGGYNDVVATDHAIKIVDANCQDQVCVHHSAIKRPGQTIVCLPHKLLVEIKSSNGATHSNSTGGLVKP